MSTDGKIASLREIYVRAAAVHFDHWLEKSCESPIERLLLAQMFAEGWGPNEGLVSWIQLHREINEMGYKPGSWILALDGAACACVAQLPVPLGPTVYRVDFAFLGMTNPGDSPVRVAVELDGHDFHERTKEQASRDKRRDRAFAANGWTVLRFSGSDVYRDPKAVVDEITRVTNLMCWPWWEDPA